MALYDGLPLNTPTKIDAASVAGDYDVWATRTANGGTVEYRPIAGGPSDLAQQADTNKRTILGQAQSALSANTTYLAIGSPSNVQVVAQVRALTQQMNKVIRLVINQLDDTN